jgi:hypothetical protein
MTKKFTISLILLLTLLYMSNAHSGTIAYLTPMPMPAQYRNFDQYQQALKVWENVYQKIVARTSNVQLPPMPMPIQYHNFDQYQQALKVWERVGSSQSRDNSYPVEAYLVRLPPMPMSIRYRNFEHYQQALQIWINVSKNLVARNINVQPPPMPMSTQYLKLEHYQNALQAWQNVFVGN